jgi:transcriptional regulator with XRE-family HTH domain
MATGIVSKHIDSDRARMRNEIRRQIVNKLSDKEYRDIFVSEQINTGLAFQIQTMREKRGWTQAELGRKTGMAQSRISVMEDANYSRLSLNTLKRLASAFDVALVVRFEPFSGLVEHFVHLDSSSLNVASFENDSFENEMLTFDALMAINSQLMSGTVLSAESYEHNFDLPRMNFSYTEASAVTHPIYAPYPENVPLQFTNIQVSSQVERVPLPA